jgi:hypothetical protein
MASRAHNSANVKKRKTIIARLHLPSFAVAAALGFLFHNYGVVIALMAFPVFFIWTIYSLVKRNGQASELGLAILLIFVFFVFSIIGDINNPPTALCADGTYSYSAHHQGTCSWHGGVDEWNPPLWWERWLQ